MKHWTGSYTACYVYITPCLILPCTQFRKQLSTLVPFFRDLVTNADQLVISRPSTTPQICPANFQLVKYIIQVTQIMNSRNHRSLCPAQLRVLGQEWRLFT